MATTEQNIAARRLTCAKCGHSYPLHGNGEGPCAAMGCGGTDGQRCPAFAFRDGEDFIAGLDMIPSQVTRAS